MNTTLTRSAYDFSLLRTARGFELVAITPECRRALKALAPESGLGFDITVKTQEEADALVAKLTEKGFRRPPTAKGGAQ